MTIQEAIKSEKQFRRIGSANWLEVNTCQWGGYVVFARHRAEYHFTINALLADDWEIKP